MAVSDVEISGAESERPLTSSSFSAKPCLATGPNAAVLLSLIMLLSDRERFIVDLEAIKWTVSISNEHRMFQTSLQVSH